MVVYERLRSLKVDITDPNEIQSSKTLTRPSPIILSRCHHPESFLLQTLFFIKVTLTLKFTWSINGDVPLQEWWRTHVQNICACHPSVGQCKIGFAPSPQPRSVNNFSELQLIFTKDYSVYYDAKSLIISSPSGRKQMNPFVIISKRVKKCTHKRSLTKCISKWVTT